MEHDWRCVDVNECKLCRPKPRNECIEITLTKQNWYREMSALYTLKDKRNFQGSRSPEVREQSQVQCPGQGKGLKGNQPHVRGTKHLTQE